LEKTIQEVFETQKFIVIRCVDQEIYDEALETKLMLGSAVLGMPEDAILRIIGHASAEEWAAQCALTQGVDIPRPTIGYFKVVAE